MHVYAQNEHCANWNSIHLDAIHDKLYTYVACDVTKDQHTNLANLSFPDNPRKTGNLAKLVNIKVGAWVMLTTNIDVSDGLTNGAMGTVVGLC